jgi:flagellar biogenesis protein FliO
MEDSFSFSFLFFILFGFFFFFFWLLRRWLEGGKALVAVRVLFCFFFRGATK